MPPGSDRSAVATGEASAALLLTFYKRAIALRRRFSPWLPSDIRWVAAKAGALVYRRERLTVACNFQSRLVRIPVRGRLALATAPLPRLKHGSLSPPPNSAAWLHPAGPRSPAPPPRTPPAWLPLPPARR